MEHADARVVVAEEEEEEVPDPDPRLPMELVCWAIPRFLDFHDARRLGAVCRELSRCWKKTVREIPNNIRASLNGCVNCDEILLEFTGLRYFDMMMGDCFRDDVLRKLTTLETLALDNIHISDHGISTLTRLNSLAVFSKSTRLTGAGIAALSGSLRKLEVYENAGIVNTITFSTLANLTSLTLYIWGTLCSGVTLGGLCQLKSLSLDDGAWVVPDDLLGLTSLTELGVQSASRYTETLSRLTSLQHLRLSGPGPWHFSSLGALTNLRHLSLRDDARGMPLVTDVLVAITRLDTLDIRYASYFNMRLLWTHSPGLIVHSCFFLRGTGRFLFIIDRRDSVTTWKYGLMHLHERRFIELGVPMDYTREHPSLRYAKTAPERITRALDKASEDFYTTPWLESDPS